MLVEGTVAFWGPVNFIFGAGLLTVVLVVWGVAADLLSIGAVWFLAGLFLVLLLVSSFGGYRVWSSAAEESREKQQLVARLQDAVADFDERFRTQPVPDEHRDQLRGHLGALIRQVRSGQRADYGDPDGGAPQNRSVLAAHFPKLVERLDEWNAAVDRSARSRPVLRQAAEAEAERYRATSDRFDGRQILLDRLCEVAAQRALDGQLGSPFNLSWGCSNYEGVHGPHPGQDRELEIHFLGRPREALAHLSSAPKETAKKRIEALWNTGDETFRAIETRPEAHEVRDAQEAVEALKVSLQDELLPLQLVTVIRSQESCPTCRRNLGITD